MQLRDAKTSELLFEGTPYAVAKMYVEGSGDYIFDDVSGFDPDQPLGGFDPQAEIARYEELEALRDDLKTSRAKGVAEQREAVQATLDALDPTE